MKNKFSPGDPVKYSEKALADLLPHQRAMLSVWRGEVSECLNSVTVRLSDGQILQDVELDGEEA